MSKTEIEDVIRETLPGAVQKNALGFIGYLRISGMEFERAGGYWKNQLYWFVTYKNEPVCYILIHGSGAEEKFYPWTVWSDDSGSKCFEDYPLDGQMKELAWKHVDLCENCGGGCSPGTTKTVFGKQFDHVCRTTVRFINPDSNTLEFMKEMIKIRKYDILKNHYHRLTKVNMRFDTRISAGSKIPVHAIIRAEILRVFREQMGRSAKADEAVGLTPGNEDNAGSWLSCREKPCLLLSIDGIYNKRCDRFFIINIQLKRK